MTVPATPKDWAWVCIARPQATKMLNTPIINTQTNLGALVAVFYYASSFDSTNQNKVTRGRDGFCPRYVYIGLR